MNKLKNHNQTLKEGLDNFYTLNSGTILRTIIYTIGHFIIAATCVWYFTGAHFTAALTDAIVEPLINGVWYFLLDKFWASKIINSNMETSLN